MKPSHRTYRIIATACILALIAAPSIWFGRQYHQQNLNHALIAAIKRSDADAVDTLLAAGADPNTRDTPPKQDSVIQKLKHLLHPEPLDRSPTVLLIALQQANPDLSFPDQEPQIVRSLLKNGAGVNAKDENGYTPLSQLFRIHVRYNRNPYKNVYKNVQSTELLEILLSAGANIETQSPVGNTPLADAEENAFFASAHILLNHGADPNVKIERDATVLKWVSNLGNLDEARLLRAHGAKE